jgi:hypothetical protein
MRRSRGAAAVLLALVAGSALLVVRHGTADDPDSGGYPQRIGFDRPSDPLPAHSGPLAGTLYDNDFGTGRMLGVSSSGDLWELPTGANVLSPSGSLLLSQGWDEEDRLVVHDLATGDQRVLKDVWPRWPWPQTHVAWSPDETAVLASFGQRGHPAQSHSAALDLATGSLTPVGDGEPAGFRSGSEAVTVRKVGGRTAPGGIVATTTDLRTGARSDLALQLSGHWRGLPDSGMAPSISPDGRTLLLVEVQDSRPTPNTVRRFSLADGAELDPRHVRDWDGCSATWLGTDPVLSTSSRHGASRIAAAQRLTADGSRSLVAVHPRLQSHCLQLTAAALEAGPRWSLFGTSTALWTWYWLPTLIAAVLLLLVLLLVARAVRRRLARARSGARRPVHDVLDDVVSG